MYAVRTKWTGSGKGRLCLYVVALYMGTEEGLIIWGLLQLILNFCPECFYILSRRYHFIASLSFHSISFQLQLAISNISKDRQTRRRRSDSIFAIQINRQNFLSSFLSNLFPYLLVMYIKLHIQTQYRYKPTFIRIRRERNYGAPDFLPISLNPRGCLKSLHVCTYFQCVREQRVPKMWAYYENFKLRFSGSFIIIFLTGLPYVLCATAGG